MILDFYQNMKAWSSAHCWACTLILILKTEMGSRESEISDQLKVLLEWYVILIEFTSVQRTSMLRGIMHIRRLRMWNVDATPNVKTFQNAKSCTTFNYLCYNRVGEFVFPFTHHKEYGWKTCFIEQYMV